MFKGEKLTCWKKARFEVFFKGISGLVEKIERKYDSLVKK